MLTLWHTLARADCASLGIGAQSLIRPVESKNQAPASISAVTGSDFGRDADGGGGWGGKLFTIYKIRCHFAILPHENQRKRKDRTISGHMKSIFLIVIFFKCVFGGHFDLRISKMSYYAIFD